jgi:hypothetical protein
VNDEQNALHEAVQFYWGERCTTHEDGCPTCEAWKQYDAVIATAPKGVLRVVKVDLHGGNQ